MWALVAGIALRVLNVQLPLGIDDGIHLLSQAAVPMLLLLLGLQMSRTRFVPKPPDFSMAALRLGAGPLAAYVAGRLVGLDHLALQVLVLQCATPTAVNALLVAAEFGGDSARAARAVVLTTILAFATLPIVMWVMGI
jgi:predicted permease